jgi:hypothetical protein
MPDRSDRADREARRVAYAAERIAAHADRELALLIRATEAENDMSARELELEADTAYRDFIALIEEHGLRR